MRCEDVRGHFADHLTGDLSDINQEVVRHLSTCGRCQAEAADLKEVWEKLAWIPERQPDMASMRARFDAMLGTQDIGASQSVYILFALYSAALLALNWFPLRQLIAYASDWDHTNASHIFLIPFITAALIYGSREHIFRASKFAPGPGLMLIAAGLMSLISATAWGKSLSEGDQLSWTTASVVGLWLGGFLFFFGTAAFRVAIFPLIFLFFSAPIPSPILQGTISILQRGSADVSFLLLKLSGTPIYRDGFTFALPGLSIIVAPECSGIRSGISLLILTLLAGHLMLRSVWRWAALLAVAVPILFFKNALRIATLSLLALHVDKHILTSELHQEGGIPFFGGGLLLIYPVLRLLMKSERTAVYGKDTAQ